MSVPKRTAALVQLPVPDPDPAAARANVPLAAGLLAAYCNAAGGMPAEAIRIIPRQLADHGGDAAILDWIVRESPDVVGFTVHMWSLRRSLLLARRIREACAGTRVVMGGPEIVRGQPVFDEPAVDCLVIGEGESSFLAALGDMRRPAGPDRVYESAGLLDLARVPNPYLAGFMPRSPDDPVYLETMRGCLHGCSYCYYGKAYPGLRFFPDPPLLSGIFEWARRHGAPEIYVMDPSFDSTPGWDERLRLLASLNSTRIPLHTEIRLESVTPERAELLAQAGFRSVEVGLQSTNPAALSAVGRSWGKERFLQGARLLTERGIVIKTGIILGLPQDTREGFAATVGFLADIGLAPHLEIYPLSVLPGTRLRAQAARSGIRFMPWPPYWVASTPTMPAQDIFDAICDAQDTLGIEIFPPIPPHFFDERPGFTCFLDLRDGRSLDHAEKNPQALANSVTVLMDARQARDNAFVDRVGAWLLRENPGGITQVVIASDAPLGAALEDRVLEAFHDPAHYFDQAHYLKPDPQASFSARLFRLAPAGASARAVEQKQNDGERAEIILRFAPSLLDAGAPLLADMPFLLMEGKAGPEAEKKLSRLYEGLPQLLVRTPGPIR